jgi:hypothetical protein
MADTISPDQFLAQLASGNGQTPNPWFTISNQFLPRNLHDVIRWSRYITVHSPTVTEVIRKLCTYPITEFLIETEDEKLKEKYQEVFRSFKLKQTLQDIGFDYYTLGNVFVSVYFPIFRTLKCPGCKQEYPAKQAGFLIFKNYQFLGKCPACPYDGPFIRKDTKSLNIKEMNIIKWAPENIACHHNPITGESEYYYRIPNDIRKRVMQGDRLFVNSVPWGFIEAIQKNQDFKFDGENIFHLRNLSTGALVEGCSIPPLISLYSLVFYQATLRKANESIATEHMNPLRVIFPQPGSSNADPVVSMSLKNFTEKMQATLKQHKRDKNYVLIAPAPVGYAALGGEGKNLLVSAEIQQAEDMILLSMGVSRELLSGQTNWTSSTVGLRLLENTLNSYVTQVLELLDWVMKKTTTYLSITPAKITLVPFKLTDDEALKQALLQMVQNGQASFSTLFEALGLDYDEELDRIKKDAVQRAIKEVQVKAEIDQAVFMEGTKSGDKLDNNVDYQAALVQAQQMVTQLRSMDPAQAQEALNEVKLSDYALYVLVDKMLKDQIVESQEMTSPEQQAQQQAEAAAGGAGMNAGDKQTKKPEAGSPKPGGAGGPPGRK